MSYRSTVSPSGSSNGKSRSSYGSLLSSGPSSIFIRKRIRIKHGIGRTRFLYQFILRTERTTGKSEYDDKVTIILWLMPSSSIDLWSLGMPGNSRFVCALRHSIRLFPRRNDAMAYGWVYFDLWSLISEFQRELLELRCSVLMRLSLSHGRTLPLPFQEDPISMQDRPPRIRLIFDLSSSHRHLSLQAIWLTDQAARLSYVILNYDRLGFDAQDFRANSRSGRCRVSEFEGEGKSYFGICFNVRANDDWIALLW